MTPEVEIPGDVQSTCGSESSHEHFEGDLSYNRGYEYRLMKAEQISKSLGSSDHLVFAADIDGFVSLGIDSTVRWAMHARAATHKMALITDSQQRRCPGGRG